MTGGTAGRAPSVLVTGGAGFIGFALCRHLASHGHEVVVFDDLSRGRRDAVPPGVRLIEGDIRDAEAVRRAIEDAEPAWVIHLAAMHFIPDCVARPHDTMDVNVEGTKRVLDGCRDRSVRHVVFASTAAVYAPSDAPCQEDATPLAALEVYGQSKIDGEQAVRAFHAHTGIACSILRLGNAVGRRETNPHVVPHIFESLQTSDTLMLGNVEPRRDYIDTRDVAAAMRAAAGAHDGLRIYNVGTGLTFSVADIVDRLQRILRRRLTVVTDASRVRPVERMVLALDTQRIRHETGWRPQLSLDDSLADLVEAYGLHASVPEP